MENLAERELFTPLREGGSDASNTERELTSFLRKACQRALDLGAADAIPLSATEIVLDERVFLKCLVPVCSFYGRNLMCPPNLMPLSQFRKILADYSAAILIRIENPQGKTTKETGRTGDLSGAWRSADLSINGKAVDQGLDSRYFQALNGAKEKLLEVIERTEAMCFQAGYRFAAGFSAGGCVLCDQCVGAGGSQGCRHPFRARPSMEAMGIDVVATAERVGLELSFGEETARSWLGLVLVA
jgi:predicted metal-binding protein